MREVVRFPANVANQMDADLWERLFDAVQKGASEGAALARLGHVRWLTTSNLAAYLGVSESTAKRTAATLQLNRHHPYPGCTVVLYDREELDMKIGQTTDRKRK